MSFDFVVIGAGASGEAAAHYARGRGASVAIVDRDLFGGSCPFWACMPSKTLLHAAEVHSHGGDYPWQKASDRRDYMINRIKTDPQLSNAEVRVMSHTGDYTRQVSKPTKTESPVESGGGGSHGEGTGGKAEGQRGEHHEEIPGEPTGQFLPGLRSPVAADAAS